MSAKIKYTNEPMGKVEVIADMLPSPEELAFKEDTVKVTISLSKSSVEFFKKEAKKHDTKYQQMIRRLLDAYTSSQDRHITNHSTDKIMAGKKSGSFDNAGIEGLAKDKPVVYDIQNKSGKTIYTGVAKKGRVEARLKEHLSDGPDPIRGGAKVKISQKSSISDAEKAEAHSIKKNQPPRNRKGK